jgi:hypothetical protein
MLYLASPYTSDRMEVQEERYMEAMKYTAKLLNQGFVVYSPILHFHPLAAEHKLPGTFEFWERLNLGMLELATTFALLHLDGWMESIGCLSELTFALKKKLPIIHILPEA